MAGRPSLRRADAGRRCLTRSTPDRRLRLVALRWDALMREAVA
jgi:hypothetical protein